MLLTVSIDFEATIFNPFASKDKFDILVRNHYNLHNVSLAAPMFIV
jgi:hypothetical protein